MKQINWQQIISKLVSFSPRQFVGERKAGDFIIKTLHVLGAPVSIQKFSHFVPKQIKAELIADGKKIACAATSFVSGRILGKENIVSSVFGFLDNAEVSGSYNINFNPFCSDISPAVFYQCPAVAVAQKNLQKIFAAHEVNGSVRVKKQKQLSRNILAGNIKNPQVIIFNHYDCINSGALDDASGVAACLEAISRKPYMLKNNLFVFAAAEELSYDKPYYWGYGYRVFEKKYLTLMNQAKSIVVVDGVGAAERLKKVPASLVLQGFPIKQIKKFQHKIFMLCVHEREFFEVYHSVLDTPQKIRYGYFREAVETIIKLAK